MGSSDLRFLLSSHNVDELSQAKLFENGIDTLAKFAAFVTSEDELTKVLKASFGLDPEASLKVRGQVASYLVAWQTARTRIKMQAEAEATSELREWAKPIPQTDYVAMRQAYAKSYGELEDKQIPSKEYLEKKLHELENGEFRAEALTEVVSRDEVDPDTLMPVWDAKGHITVKRGNTTVAMPTGPEQLRMRLTVMANTLIMMRMKHTARNELKDIAPAFFEKYKDYLLGDYVYGLRASDDYGGTSLDFGAKLRARYSQALLQDHGTAGIALQASARKVLQGCYSQGEALHNAHNAPSPLCQTRIHRYIDSYARRYHRQRQQGQGQGQVQGQEGPC